VILDASLNEVETLAAKAARGAGLTWGLAEDAAKAARWLAAFGLPWPETLLRLLAARNAPAIATLETATGVHLSGADGGSLSPLLCGPHLGDRAADFAATSVHLVKVATPLWLLPFAAQAAFATRRPVRLRSSPADVLVERRRCVLLRGSLEALAGNDPVDVACEAGTGEHDGIDLAPVDRARVPIDTWGALEALAARTYVPASERSRALGAGAGETDND
jgi:Protein of unknown function (DUF3726)